MAANAAAGAGAAPAPEKTPEQLFKDQPKAVQIVSIDTNTGSFSVNDKAMECILGGPEVSGLPVVVISVAGPFRKGKSFLLNFFLRYLTNEASIDWLGEDTQALEGFKWRPGSERDTVGIWMWNTPFVRRTANNELVAVLLVDTQGTFDNKSTMHENAGIFALNALFSSFHVYNISGLIAEDILQHMHLFTQYGQLVRESEGSSSAKPFQTLMFLVRDWANPREYPYGETGGSKYLESVLNVDNAAKNEELRNVRIQIQNCFEKLRCFLMPHPGFEVAENSEFAGQIKDIRGEFVKQLRELVPLILSPENLIIKDISGEHMKCGELHTYMKTFVGLFENGQLPKVGTVFEATAKVNHMNVKDRVFNAYRKSILDHVGPGRPFMQEEELVKLHERYQQEALDKYQKTRKLGSSQYAAEFQEQLLAEIKKSYDEALEANRHKQLLANMRTPIVLGAIAFLGNIVGTTLSLFGLETIGVLMGYITWIALFAVAFWLWSSFSGQMHTAVGEIDNFARTIEAFCRARAAQYLTGDFGVGAAKKND